MIIGIPSESKKYGLDEHRVGLSPTGVFELIRSGAEVIVEKGAGEEARFTDDNYREAGARIVYAKEEVLRTADLIAKVHCHDEIDCKMIKKDQIVCGFLLLFVAQEKTIRTFLNNNITAIGYENIETEPDVRPIRSRMAEIAGRLSVQIAGRLLESRKKGRRGILLGGVPGVAPAEVVILGGGSLGFAAAKTFAGIGANVYVLDVDLDRLQKIEQTLHGRVVTLISNQRNIERLTKFADVLIGAVLTPGTRTPTLVTRQMVSQMKRGSVIIDFSIDQGGCCETSRFCPGEDLIYVEEGVIHFAVPNTPSLVARTATHVLNQSVVPYLKKIVKEGLVEAIRTSKPLARGVYTYQGKVVHPSLYNFNYPQADLKDLL
ncbi:MAG TPA: alanine dehydrogenase [bacterium (Candidatus Stahlbacteria)]|nr:alanine dehydrogenase [Candidatus Stahlbacteria bacterium]